jgi:hypothetical protein
MKNFKVLSLPILLILLILLIDKFFLLEVFHKEFLQTGNQIYYKHREHLIQRLKTDSKKSEKKIILALGDSRAYSYSDLAFFDKPERKNNYSIYNFSAPQAVPAYSLYILEKIVKDDIKIDSIFLSLSPEGFDDNKRLISSPFLRLGSDDEFFLKYYNYIPFEDRYEFLLDKVFTMRKIEFNFSLFWNRFTKKELSQYKKMYNKEFMILDLYKGEQLAYTTFENDIPKLQKDSIRMSNIYFYNYTIHPTQFKFVEEILIITKEKGIQTNLIFPRVYVDYRKNFNKYSIYPNWWNKIVEMANKYNAKSFDFNEESNCDMFYDASHQSTLCYYQQINGMMDVLNKN